VATVVNTAALGKQKIRLFSLPGRGTRIFDFKEGRSVCDALNSWAAQQHRPTKDVNAGSSSLMGI
jgi:hypothetical protein